MRVPPKPNVDKNLAGKKPSPEDLATLEAISAKTTDDIASAEEGLKKVSRRLAKL